MKLLLTNLYNKNIENNKEYIQEIQNRRMRTSQEYLVNNEMTINTMKFGMIGRIQSGVKCSSCGGAK